MPRPPRIQVAGGVYHVATVGVRRSALFRDDHDRAAWLDLLPLLVARYRWLCHGYCLLTTHYHVLVTTPLPNLAAGMQWLNGCWGQRFTRRHREVGHVHRARYSSVLIERDEHALEVVRYIALNPVRAGICLHPLDWPWSSYAGTVEANPDEPHLDRDTVLKWFDGSRDALRTYVEDALSV